MKQLGRQPWENGQALKLESSKGGDPTEWPEDKLVGEIKQFRTVDGKSITTNTRYNTYNGRVTSQTVNVADSNGKVRTTTTIGGKLLP